MGLEANGSAKLQIPDCGSRLKSQEPGAGKEYNRNMEVVLLEGPAQRQLGLDHKSKKVGPLRTLAKILIHLPDDWQTTITFYALSSMIQYHLCPYWARILSSKHQSCGFFFERHIILSICDVYFKGRWLTWFSHGEILSQHENQPIRCTNHGN